VLAQPTTIAAIVDAALYRLGDQLVVDQGRCVDVYLDLYAATTDLGLRTSLADRIDDIRHLSLVDSDEFRADLAAFVAIASDPAVAVRPAAPVTLVLAA
jgi:hypothetical protein